MVDDRVVRDDAVDDEDAAVEQAVDEFVNSTFGPGVVVERETEVPEQPASAPVVAEHPVAASTGTRRVVRGGTAQNR